MYNAVINEDIDEIEKLILKERFNLNKSVTPKYEYNALGKLSYWS